MFLCPKNYLIHMYDKHCKALFIKQVLPKFAKPVNPKSLNFTNSFRIYYQNYSLIQLFPKLTYS